MITIIFKTSRL